MMLKLKRHDVKGEPVSGAVHPDEDWGRLGGVRLAREEWAARQGVPPAGLDGDDYSRLGCPRG